MSKISERYAHLSPLKQALLALEEMSSKLNKIERQQTEPIAIVGISCRFPGGANNPELFWQLLHNGVDAIGEVPPQRWDVDAYYDPNPETPGKMYTRSAGFLDVGVDEFDAEFFGLAPREIMSMDPQQRLLLEVCWEALENAGQAPDKLVGSQTGVFIGINTNDYSQLHLGSRDADHLNAYFFTGNTSSVAAGRLSYFLGLEGPSIALDTACSSSLVTVHLACQSLRAGECDLAMAGGVNLMLLPDGPIILSKMRALAADGRCKTFDAAADGYGRGEGCGIVVLKRLSDAVANGDKILALIRGSTVNHDGRSSGLTVPNGLAQQKLIRAALANAKVEPNEVSYVEVHGTGTALGDPIEVEALAAVLRAGRSQQQPVIMGSVKTNIGHLEAAAGVASLIKVVLAMQHKKIPPHLHLKNPIPSISWEDLPVVIPTKLTTWSTATGQRRLGAISSFGMSGTNAHAVLEEAPILEPILAEVERPVHLLSLSAKNEAALKELVSRIIGYLDQHAESLANICFTANTGRSHFAHRLTVVALEPAQIIEQLTTFATGKVPDGVLSGFVPRNSRLKLGFLFTGQGSQYVDMGRQLYETQPTFRKALERCDEILRPYLEQPLVSVLYPEPGTTSPLNETAYTQPALFALEYALFELWRSWGITPEVVMGHSVGEYVAACVAGVFSLEDGLKLIAQRGRLMQALHPNGEMAAVFASEALVAAAIEPLAGQVSIAAINGPKNIVISGKGEAVQAVIFELEAKGVESRRLKVSHAFHSPLMEPMLDAFEQIAAEVKYSSPKIRMISNITGKLVEATEITQTQYWRRHIRETVQFSAGMQTLHKQGYQLFVEIGPHPVLLEMGRRCLPEDTGVWLPSLRKGQSDWQQQLQSLGELYVRGTEVDWCGFDRDYPRYRLQLPTYPFQRSRYWLEPMASESVTAPLQESKQPFDSFNNWLYEVEWLPQPRKNAESFSTTIKLNQHSKWLIFADQNSSLGSALANLLKEYGETCIMVFPGEAYEVDKAGHWTINPAQPEDFQRLLKEILGTDGLPCRGIVHLWSLDNNLIEETTVDFLQKYQIQSCGSVLHLVQALISIKIPNLPRLWIATQSAQSVEATDSLAVAQTPVLGLGRVIAVEHPEIWGGLIDLAPGNFQEAAINCLEEIWQPDGEFEVAFRKGQRYAPRLASFTKQNAENSSRFSILSDSTYLITGGLGGLGLNIAKWMIDIGARHLVLVGRKAISKDASEQLSKLKETGAEVIVLAADISKESDVQNLLAVIAESLPPLRGIIHLAGVIDDGVLLRQDWERFALVMAPKVAGAWNLHSQTQNIPLDFFVLFSSIASMLGSPGQGNYSAANAFLDALARYRQSQKLPALSINWSPWGETGMAANLGSRGELRWTAAGVSVIAPEQGLQVLEQLLGESAAQVGVLPVDWSKFFEHFTADFKPPFFSQIKYNFDSNNGTKSHLKQINHEFLRSLQEAHPKQRKAILIAYLQSDVSTVLGIDSSRKLDPQLGFFEMGMDSLMTLEFKNRLQATLGHSLPSTLTFEYPTIDALAEYLISEVIFGDSQLLPVNNFQKDADENAEILASIEKLSSNELEVLVNAELEALMKEC